jgi:hypothetical protein
VSRSGRARRNRLPELSLRTWLLYSHLLVLALPLLALIGTGALARDLIDQTRADLEHQADVLAVFVGDLAREQARAGEGSELEPLAERVEPLLVEVRERTLAGVRLLDERGFVIAAGGWIDRVDLSDDPEVAAALAGETGVAMR